ncbi:MAG: HAMP domain-containing sensor histidine kinase, partial [Oscillospiraceae bacterium]
MAVKKRSISRRWLINSLGVIVLILLIFISCLSFAIQSYVYNGIQQALIGRSDELLNVFASSSGSEFNTISRAYIENFPDKNDMEIMSISRAGSVVVTSTGFAPDQRQAMPDYMNALAAENNFGYWIGKLDTGEKVMAITRVVRNSNEVVVGSIRYLVSMEKADAQIGIFVTVLIGVGAVVTLLIIFSGVYFIRSIVTPVKQITTTAKKIARGEFDVRIEKSHEDEIGQLIDTINDMAEELGNTEKMKNDFISSVSHELRTPLTAIKGWAETIGSGGQDRATEEKGMQVIIKEAARLSGIVEELLDFSRIQSGRMSLMLNKIDLLAELDEAVFLFTDRARTERKKLIYEEGTMLSPILGDVNRLRQVFVNILDNALKYTDEGGTVMVVPSEKDGIISVAIADNGCGIPPEHLPNVKKKFYKANQVVRGSGIGLAVADEI